MLGTGNSVCSVQTLVRKPGTMKWIKLRGKNMYSPTETVTVAQKFPNIQLDERDWFYGRWIRESRVTKTPECRPFDLRALLKKRESLLRNRVLVPADDISEFFIKHDITPFHITAQEAEFWIRAFHPPHHPPTTSADMLSRSQSFPYTGEMSVQDIKLTTGALQGEWSIKATFALPLLSVLKLEQVPLLFSALPAIGSARCANAFRLYVLPYLTNEVIKELRQKCPVEQDPSQANYLYASCLGMHEVVLPRLNTLEDGSGWTPSMVAELIFGLQTSSEIENQLRKFLKGTFQLFLPHHAKFILATLGQNGLDIITQTALALGNAESDDWMDVLTLAELPETAKEMVEIYNKHRRLRPKARAWLMQFPEWSINELQRQSAGDQLVAEELAILIADIQKCASPKPDSPDGEACKLLDDGQTVSWLRTIEKSNLRPGTIPGWADPRMLAPIVFEGNQIGPELVRRILLALQQSTYEKIHPLITEVQVHVDRNTTDAFGWDLFDRWLREGAPPKEKWVMNGVGFFCGDQSASRLTTLICTWPGEGQSARAVNGLECLRQIGSDAALLQLSKISRTTKFKALKARALESMEKIAAARSLEREQLEDKLIPDCDLDKNGQRRFCFGARDFCFVLGPNLEPQVRDQTGKIKGALPKPDQADDLELASKAIKEWKAFKELISQVSQMQVRRFEDAMVVGRRWHVEEFRQLLQKPLPGLLGRRIIWAAYDAQNRDLVQTFTVSEDGRFINTDNRNISLTDDALIGVVHAAYLDETTTKEWGEFLSDYEVFAPFQQLTRPRKGLKKDDLAACVLHRKIINVDVPSLVLVTLLEKKWWRRKEGQSDHGTDRRYYKHFFASNITAVIKYSSYAYESNVRELDCYFMEGLSEPNCFVSPEGLPLLEVDPIVISEVLLSIPEALLERE